VQRVPERNRQTKASVIHAFQVMEDWMNGTDTNPALLAAHNYEKTIVANTMLPFAAFLLEITDLRPGERVVDVACGTGAVVRQAVQIVGPDGAVVGIDLNPAMLAVGQSVVRANGTPVEWREANAQALPLEDNSYDVATCHHGLQFIPDRVGALREMYRVLRPGGRAAAAVWRSLEHNPVSQLIWETVARHLDATVDSLIPSFSLGNAETLCALFEAAGFADISVHARRHTVREPYDPQFIRRALAGLGNMSPRFAAMSDDERSATIEGVLRETEPALQRYTEGSDRVFPYAAYITLGRKIVA
jgi:ubiquinone/menaquinone biosynthesis C-methylase UbiE